jgi:hypothetical protein
MAAAMYAAAGAADEAVHQGAFQNIRRNLGRFGMTSMNSEKN